MSNQLNINNLIAKGFTLNNNPLTTELGDKLSDKTRLLIVLNSGVKIWASHIINSAETQFFVDKGVKVAKL